MGSKISTYPWIISLFGFQIEHPYDNMHMGVEKIPSTCPFDKNWSLNAQDQDYCCRQHQIVFLLRKESTST